MSTYNAKNYTEQGGEKTVIGGTLEFGDGASVENFPGAANQAKSTATSVADLKGDLNALLTKLKDAGVMEGDAWNLSISSATLHDLPTAETLSNTGHAEVTLSDGVITIALDCKVKDLADADHGSTWGVHKWIGIGITTGLGTSVAGVVFDDGTAKVTLTADDDSEASSVGLTTGDFILYIKAEKIFANGGQFKLSGLGKAKTTYTLKVTES